MRLLPANLAAAKGATFTINIQVEPNGQETKAVDVFLDFNPTHLQVTKVSLDEASPLNLELNKTYNNNLGTIDVSAGKLIGAGPSTTFIMANLTIQTQQVDAVTNIAFSSRFPRKTIASISGEEIQRNLVGSTITIGNPPAATPTPTAIPPTATVTASPTRVPSAPISTAALTPTATPPTAGPTTIPIGTSTQTPVITPMPAAAPTTASSGATPTSVSTSLTPAVMPTPAAAYLSATPAGTPAVITTTPVPAVAESGRLSPGLVIAGSVLLVGGAAIIFWRLRGF